MASKTIYLTGTAEWAKVYENNRDMNEGFHGPDGAYTIDLIMDKENMDELAATGSRLSSKADEAGLRVKFKRKHTHPTIPAFGGAPQVVKGDTRDDTETFTSIIGNGSTVEIAVTVYDTKMGKGTRLEGVRVIDLVEYESPEDGEERQPALPFS